MSGKTSLAKVVANELRKEGYDSIYVNLIGAGGIRACAERILSSIPRSLIEPIESLKGYLEAFNIKLGGEIKFGSQISSARILEKVFLDSI